MKSNIRNEENEVVELYFRELGPKIKKYINEGHEIELIISNPGSIGPFDDRVLFFNFLDKIGFDYKLKFNDSIINNGPTESYRNREYDRDVKWVIPEDLEDETIMKSIVNSHMFENLFCKMNIKHESDISIPSNREVSLLRKVTRYKKENEFSVLDMSIVETYEPRKIFSLSGQTFGWSESPRITYEIELELIENETHTSDVIVDEFIKDYILYLKVFLKTELLYTAEELSDFIYKINVILKRKSVGTEVKRSSDKKLERKRINTDHFSKPRTMKFEDLMSKNILRKVTNLRTRDKEPYFNYVTYKGDGEREILFISGDLGIWMFYGLFYSLVSREVGENVKMSMFSTEYFNLKDVNKFEIIDVLFYEGKDVREYIMISSPDVKGTSRYGSNSYFDIDDVVSEYNIKSYGKYSRLSYAAEYISTAGEADKIDLTAINIKGVSINTYITNLRNMNLNGNIGAEIHIKPYRALNKGNDLAFSFFNGINFILDFIEEVASVNTDGVIIVTGNEKYMDGRRGDFPSTVKWKPLDKFTIDFALYHGDTEEVPHVLKISKGRGKDRHYEEFYAPQFDPTKVEIQEEYINYEDGQVMEMYWDVSDKDNEVFKVYRPRFDKDANSATDARANWRNIKNYITEDILRGDDTEFTLLKKYHNSIKKSLFDDVKNVIKGNYVLDIGSGRGADIGKIIEQSPKWIIFLEPDEKAHVELERRLRERDRPITNYSILHTTGQDWRNISDYIMERTEGEGVKVVSAMNSLTFFWKSERDLQLLSNTINTVIADNARFVYMLMDGNVVTREYYRNKSSLIEKQIEKGKASITFSSQPSGIYGNEIQFSFPGFVSEQAGRQTDTPEEDIQQQGTQTEYLSYIDSLLVLLNYERLSNDRYADGSELMSGDDIYISKLYRYGSVKLSKIKTLIDIEPDDNPNFSIIDAKHVEVSYDKENVKFILSASKEKRSIPLLEDVPDVSLDLFFREADEGNGIIDVFVSVIKNNKEFLSPIFSQVSIREDLFLILSRHLTEITFIDDKNAIDFFGFPYSYWDIFYMDIFLRQLKVAVKETEERSLKEFKYRNYSIVGVQNYLINIKKGLGNEDILYISFLLGLNIYFIEPSKTPTVGTPIYRNENYTIQKSYDIGSDICIVILQYKSNGWIYENISVNGEYILDTSYVLSLFEGKIYGRTNGLNLDTVDKFRTHIDDIFKDNDLVDIYIWYKIVSSSPTLNIMKKLTGSLNQFEYFKDWENDTNKIVPYRFYSYLPYYRFKLQRYEHFEFMIQLFAQFDDKYRDTVIRNYELATISNIILDVLSERIYNPSTKKYIWNTGFVADLKYRYFGETNYQNVF